MPSTSTKGHCSNAIVDIMATSSLLLFGVITYWYHQHQMRRESQKQRKDRTEYSADEIWNRLQLDSTMTVHDDGRNDVIYLDYNGTTPVYPAVIQAMMPYWTIHYGNPSSSHIMGQQPRLAVNEARRAILHDLLGVPFVPSSNLQQQQQQQETWTTTKTAQLHSIENSKQQQQQQLEQEYLSSIWFTSCGTESDNLAIHLALQAAKGAAVRSNGSPPPHIVTCNIEHPAILSCLQVLESQGQCELTIVPVERDGRVQANKVIAAIRLPAEQEEGNIHDEQRPSPTALVTIMLANNESGAIQPVVEIATYCRKNDILFHTDAAQAAGKVSVQLADLGYPDMISLVGHKIGAPKGVACLYVRPHCWNNRSNGPMFRQLSHRHGILLIGGGQEFGRRGGTENVASIVGMGQAARIAAAHLTTNAKHMEQMRCRLLDQLQNLLGGPTRVQANGPVDPTLRLPNTLSVGFWNIHSGDLLATVGHQVAASAGATSHSASSISAVLQAMQVPEEFARGTVRLSFGPTITVSQIDRAAQILATAVQDQWNAQQQQQQ